MKSYDIITLGDLCVDLIMAGGDIVPRFGQAEQLVNTYDLEMGGSCSIFACQAAKLGMRVGILGKVGDDVFGELILDRLDESGVDTRYVHVDPSLKTGISVALCKDDDRAILTHMGSINALQPEDVTDDFLRSAHHLHYGSFFLHTGLRPNAPAIVERAKALGLSVSLDTNWDPEEQWDGGLTEMLPMVDVFLPNEEEAVRIAGCGSVDAAVDAFRARGVDVLALKRGGDGADVYAGDAHHTCTLPPAKAGGDSVGAGDSFDAGFLTGWLQDMSMARSLAIACHCGRGVAGEVGGLRGQPTWAQITARLGE
jgi:sugar/nucleoside kinase (ribokinase family)